VIEAVDVVKSFPPRTILRGINLKVETGETLVIIGGSGCGKSTFLKCVIGLHHPTSGRVTVDGLEVAKMRTDRDISDYRRRFGYLFQEGALFDSMTVAENITFGLRYLTDVPQGKWPKIATDCLALVGLKDIENFKPSELSGGMKKRVALARAIAAQPQYILYDEPTTGLDPIMSDVINDLILDLQKQLKVTSIVVTHDMKSAYKVASRIAMFHEGRVIQIGTPDEIRQSKDPHVHQFIEGLSVGPIKMKLKEFDADDSHQAAAAAAAKEKA
jgi:phospholipid/cholesterol/gamma-HCH transport system ATP-binding protein